LATGQDRVSSSTGETGDTAYDMAKLNGHEHVVAFLAQSGYSSPAARTAAPTTQPVVAAIDVRSSSSSASAAAAAAPSLSPPPEGLVVAGVAGGVTTPLRRQQSVDDERRTVWVGGIPAQLVAEPSCAVLRRMFGAFGQIAAVTPRQKPGENKSWAFVTFAKEEVGAALSLPMHRSHAPVSLPGLAPPRGT
jgi:hypothetical protein